MMITALTASAKEGTSKMWLSVGADGLKYVRACVFDIQDATAERMAVDCPIVETEEEPEIRLYDKEEVYHGCTVQVLTNTVTGAVSMGWMKEE